MKNKLILLIIILFVIGCFAGCNKYSMEEKEVMDIIKSFYSAQYEAYSNFAYRDIEPFLDMNKIQNKNKVIALKRLIIENKYLEDMKYCYINKNIYPINFIVKKININGDFAQVDLELELEEGKYYPDFVSDGENSFVLKKMNGDWKIVNHDYASFINFEKSHKTLQPDEDEEKIKRIIDNEYGESPFGIEKSF